MSVMGALMAAVAGVLAVAAWQNAFYTYVIAIPVLIMLVAFLPKFPAAHDTGANGNPSPKTTEAPKGWWTPHPAERADILRRDPLFRRRA